MRGRLHSTANALSNRLYPRPFIFFTLICTGMRSFIASTWLITPITLPLALSAPWSGGQECPEKAEVSTFVGEGTPVHDFARRSLFAVERTAAPTSEESSYLHLKNEQN